eukprot:10749339-Alexandrium_andersonii.AAC.1
MPLAFGGFGTTMPLAMLFAFAGFGTTMPLAFGGSGQEAAEAPKGRKEAKTFPLGTMPLATAFGGG